MNANAGLPPKVATRALWSTTVLVVCLAGVVLNAASFSLQPRKLPFGSQAVGTSNASGRVILTNRARTPLQFSMTVSGDFAAVSLCGASVPANGGTCELAITFTPTAVGTRTGTLLVTNVNRANDKGTVNLSGVGAAATVVSPQALSFGSVAVQTTSPVQNVVFTNNLDTALTGIVVETSHPDYAAGNCPTPLAARTSCTIPVTFTPTAAPGTVEAATLTITHSGAASPQTVALSGTSVTPFSLSTASVAFAPTFQGQTATATVTLTNNQSATLSGVTLSAAAPFSATGCGGNVQGGRTCAITLTLAPTLAHEGPLAGVLTVSTATPAQTETVSLSGTALRPVTVAPTLLAFGGVTVASASAPLVVTVTNQQPTTLTFGSTLASFSGLAAGDFAVASTTCGATLAGGASCTIDVTVRPTVGGARAAVMGVNSNAYGSPHGVTLSAIGTTPLTIEPPALEFGSVNVGLASAGQAVTVRNNQSVPVAFTGIAANGDFAVSAVGTTCGATLAAAASCVVTVTASPTMAGPRSGSLVITSDTTESPNTVALAATGVNGMTPSVTSLTFGSQAINTTGGAQQVVVTNHQSVPAALGTVVTGDFAATDACGGTVPASSSCVVSITFTPTAEGTRAGTATFNNPGSAPSIVSLTGTGTGTGPLPAVASVVPGAGTRGTTLIGVVVTGNGHTNFGATSTVSLGDGVTVSNLAVVSPDVLTVDLSIAADAVPGVRTVTVTTVLGGGEIETAELAAGFVVSASAELPIASVAPDQGAQGQTLHVTIVGTNTHFQAGTTFATFGDGIAVDALAVQDQTHAVATITVSPTTAPGWRTVMLVTGGEIATIAPVGVDGPGFLVVSGQATLVSVSPASGAQGAAPFVVTVTGNATHFLQGATSVSFGEGIDVGSVQVLGDTTLDASIAVTAGAALGPRDVVATTGGEVATLAAGFEVTAAPPPVLSSVTPASGAQGEIVSLTIVGSNTHFTTDTPAPTLTLGSSIAIDALTVVDDTTITATASIDVLAETGPRQGTLSSGGTNFSFAFSVSPSTAAVLAVQPASVPQGAVATVTVTGQDTHWAQGTTTASMTWPSGGCPASAVNAVSVESPTRALVTVTVPTTACVGQHLLQLATGGEVVGTSVGVYEQMPSLGLGPSNGMPGTTVTVNFVGEFTHFDGSTTAVIDGTGIGVQSFAVTSAVSATARFVVASDAPAGGRTVTLTTPLGSGAFEVVTAPFAVTTTPAVLTAIEPFSLTRGSSSPVTIRGAFTSFGSETTVGFGPGIEVGPPAIVSETELAVQVTVASDAALGWRSAFVNTGAEQLTIGFRVDGPSAPALTSVTPSSAVQGQSLSVSIAGANTSFNESSQLILGAGVTVADFQVTGPTTATATVAVSPTAPLGPNSVIVQTTTGPGQVEYASGAGFTVLQGPSQILSVSPAVAGQGQTLNVNVVGQGTHWLQGATTADFGAGVVVADLTILDETHATARILVLSGAAPGFRQVTFVTDGEYAFIGQGLAIQEGTPTLVSSSPNAGAQGTTFDIQVLGSLTHWENGVSTASYGAGVTVNSFTVSDSVSGVLSVSINPLAFVTSSPTCHALTITTGTEQVSLPNQLCVQPGAAALTTVSPNAAPQGSTLTVAVTGQNTHFTAGLTTADFGQGINTSNVAVTSPTTATVDLAVSTQATPGFRTALMTTLGESAALSLAFEVGPNTPTLNAASPFSAQPGQSLTVRLIGQYTHWQQGTTTATFGQGITVTSVSVVDPSTADVSVVVDPLAAIGGRVVTVATGGEIVSATVFSVVPGGAIISQVAPQSGNQGQEIVLEITGQNTNWQQGFTQFAMAGAGGDITVNYVTIGSPTSATVA
jgi:hypothetical protein